MNAFIQRCAIVRRVDNRCFNVKFSKKGETILLKMTFECSMKILFTLLTHRKCVFSEKSYFNMERP